MEVKTLKDIDLSKNPVIGQMGLYNHEQILFCNDNATGLKAIIAIHNTVLGPSLGGTRMWNYNNEMEALNDVLRLSRGMTYKNAMAELPMGGGKSVIIGVAGAGAATLTAGDRPQVLVLLPGTDRGSAMALVVSAGCSSTDAGLVADAVILDPPATAAQPSR